MSAAFLTCLTGLLCTQYGMNAGQDKAGLEFPPGSQAEMSETVWGSLCNGTAGK